ncbi:MAG: thioredoxin-dependent thiol peroxidase [Crocinitomicaceae bacterium]|nr:thioredoxin-dependent thiol peroxidase [Crocinitomicaceae bacterium]
MKKLTIGDKAPGFSGLDQQGNTINLTDYKGQKVVLYFYPKDNTPGCTAQACNLRDNESILLEKNIKVIGVSADSVISHDKFSTKYHLNFPIIADTEKIILTSYGVWGEKKFMGRTYNGIHRTTFLINEDQQIIDIITKPNTKNHTEEILKLLEK